LRARAARAGAAARRQLAAEGEELVSRRGHVRGPAARRADVGEERGIVQLAAGAHSGLMILAMVSREGLGILAVVITRVERRAAAEEELAHFDGVRAAGGSSMERGMAPATRRAIALIDVSAGVQQEDRCVASVVMGGDVQRQ